VKFFDITLQLLMQQFKQSIKKLLKPISYKSLIYEIGSRIELLFGYEFEELK